MITLFLLLLIAVIIIAWQVFPLISGYGAKYLASSIYLQHRNANDVIKEDLGDFPKSLASYTFDEKDSSVTGSVWGFAKRKAIYRKGLGCTLINEFSETSIRRQQFDLPAVPASNADTIPWPYGDKIIDSIPSAVNIAALNNAVNNVMKESKNGVPAYTRAVLVLYDGKIVAEQYAPGFDKHTVLLGWSMSKSLTAAMIGILVQQGKLNINAPAPVPEWKGSSKEKITLLNLLQQTTGLDFEEVYTRPSEVTKMLFNYGDMAAYTAKLPLKYKPGTVFNYSSGNTNIISRIVRQTIGERAYAAFPYTALFHKINAYSFLLEPDASGTYIGSSYSYGTARDFARFGLLYYNNGKWNGEQILPENWVRESVVSPAANPYKNYGYQFWLNGKDEKDSTKEAFPDVPKDMFYMDGYGGQDVYIIPSKKLIVARFGVHVIDENKFLKEVIQSITIVRLKYK
ncbi:MAG: serine hydrolase [Sphingobacteriales bacterium]|nr:serine hydrolase [Sphingobacteriales bacterium]